jgi:hypothetical protein
MHGLAIRRVVLAVSAVIVASPLLLAEGPQSRSTETHLYAKLVGVGSQPLAYGYARNYVVTFSNTSTRQSHALFSAALRYLKLPQGTIVTLQLNGTPIGTATIREYNRGHLRLLTRLGDTVPIVNVGDTLAVIDPNGVIVLTGAFEIGPDPH